MAVSEADVKAVMRDVLLSSGYSGRGGRFTYTSANGADVRFRYIRTERDPYWFQINRTIDFLGDEVPAELPDNLRSWGSVDAPPGVAKWPRHSGAVWDSDSPNCLTELRRVLTGVASLLHRYADQGFKPKREGVYIDETVGPFGMPGFDGGQQVRHFVDNDGLPFAEIKRCVENLTHLYPENEWVRHWAALFAARVNAAAKD